MNDKVLLVFIKPPETQSLNQPQPKNFEDKKLCSVYIEIAKKTFAKLSLLENIKTMPVYEKTSKYPDLRWLSAEDPGFLVQRGINKCEKFKNAAKWALDTGANTIGAVWLDMFYINTNHITKAFEILKQKHTVLGKSKEGECYFIGFNKSAEVIPTKIATNNTSDIYQKIENICQQLKFSVYQLSQTYSINNKQSYHQWLADIKKVPHKFRGGLFDLSKK